mmetsp:Transcript_58463/g.128168  ORF Transcript_58463/g.128168 Transcript_58463/m.128168 type:complete len:210 (-) Transcript_58463:89-718(-)|eukprot:CAMPEP_0204262472 /NCGR_PEP_ID=MMETSP0468-20130131/7703_1 /ASSEMBLY_ACC=CAM_ASM_000383 /TAXON_ID=2969 /ORGANISM="Oxyrrhis marina" /LENGTH=209 /DNA_ID=CAMNT_0051237141 /DNA_START=105 /DNA_END=734 /DNA_ORIENTATION=+
MNSRLFEDEVKPEKPIPVFLQNPDGSFAEGVPPGYREKSPPLTPRGSAGSQWYDESVAEEFEYLYCRHEKLFLSLLLAEFTAELTFNCLYVYYAEYSLREVSLVYHHLSQKTLWTLFWVMFGLECAFCAVYYSLGFVAIAKHRPSYYRYFANSALVGFLGQVLLAYMNKFNLLVFFLRLMAYIYAKFLRNLLQSMLLLPTSGQVDREAH